MGNSSIRLLKKRNKKKSMNLIQLIIDLFEDENDILCNFNRPDLERVFRICKAIKPGKFSMNTLNDFNSFKYPLSRIKENIEIIHKEKSNVFSLQNRKKTIEEHINRIDKYSLKIFENYQEANRNAAIDELLK